MQPKDPKYLTLDHDATHSFSYLNRMQQRDPMKLSDIDGAAPSRIPGYTGAKVHSLLHHNKYDHAIQNYGPSKLYSSNSVAKMDQTKEWQQVTKKYNQGSLFNPSVYKTEFNQGAPVKPKGILPS